MTNPEPLYPVPVVEALERPMTHEDSLVCAAHTIGTVSLNSFPYGGNAEPRYLGDEILATGNYGSLLLASSLVALCESGMYGADGARLLSYDFLEGSVEEGSRAREAWPRQLIKHARTEDIFVQEEWSEAVASSDRWQMDPGTKGDPSPHVTLWHTEGDRTHKQIVRLDDLNHTDPEFLRQHLRWLHARSSVSRMAQLLIDNRDIHDTRTALVVPEYMQEIAQLPPGVKRQEATRNILALIKQIALSSGDISSRAYNMATDIAAPSSLARFSHMFSCPTQPGHIKDNNEDLFHFSQQIQQVVMEAHKKTVPPPDAYNFREQPYNLLPDHLDVIGAELTEQYAETQELVAFIKAGLEAANPNEFIKLLEDKMFSTAALYAQIRDALDKPIAANNHLDEAISWAAKHINRSPETPTRQEILDAITRGFTDYRATLDQLDLVSFGHQGRVHIKGAAIQATLVLLACAHAKKQSLETTGRISEQAVLLETEILENHTEFLLTTEQQISENDEIRAAASVFKQEHNITDEDTTWLSSVSVNEDGELDESLFMTVFHGLLLEKQGIIKLRRPWMIAFIRDFLSNGGELSPERAEKLDRLFLKV